MRPTNKESWTVRIHFVDGSYYDDGSRWTWASFNFESAEEALAFYEDSIKNGFVWRSPVSGRVETFFVETAEDIDIIHITERSISKEELSSMVMKSAQLKYGSGEGI